MTQPLRIEAEVEILKETRLGMSLQVLEEDHRPILHATASDARCALPREPGTYRFMIEIPPLLLYPGNYRLGLYLGEQFGDSYEPLDRVSEVGVTIEQDYQLVGRELSRRAGLVYRDVGWRFESLLESRARGVAVHFFPVHDLVDVIVDDGVSDALLASIEFQLGWFRASGPKGCRHTLRVEPIERSVGLAPARRSTARGARRGAAR